MKLLPIIITSLFLLITPCHANILPLLQSKTSVTQNDECFVKRVVDGDTFVCADDTVVRLKGIDAPEKDQPFGLTSKTMLEQFALNRSVHLKGKTEDIYSRRIAVVWLGDQNINLAMVQEGYAWDYTHYDKANVYAAAQADALGHKRGLWKQEAIAPWEWRNAKKIAETKK